jgi:enoyl-CoA hydratase
MRTEDYPIMNVEVKENIAYATFKGSDEMHRYDTFDLYTELARLGAELRDSKEIRALVVTGTDDIFTLGSEPATAATFRDYTGPDLAKNVGRQYIREFLDLDTPVITALNGIALAGMLSFILLSDIVVAEEHATIRDLHVPMGAPSSTGPFLWPPSVGLMKARRYLLTGDRLTAVEAERIGLFTEVVPKGQSLRRATEYAHQLASLAPGAVSGTKRALNQWLKMVFPTIFDAGLSVQFLAMTLPAFAHESMDALQEQELANVRGQ